MEDNSSRLSKYNIARMLYSISDFEVALSAADFLYEFDAGKRYSVIELRRFKCYETTAIVSYARPFSQSRGALPRLEMTSIGVTLTLEQQQLHEKLITLRNKKFAHSDEDFFRLASQVGEITITGRQTMNIVQTVFDEGLEFSAFKDQVKLVNLIRKVSFGLNEKILELAQSEPRLFDLKKDYLEK